MPTREPDTSLPYIWVRKLDAEADQRMYQENDNGRQVVALELMPKYSLPLKSCRWQPPLEGAKSWILESGSKRFEVSTFNHLTKQDRHYHKGVQPAFRASNRNDLSLTDEGTTGRQCPLRMCKTGSKTED